MPFEEYSELVGAPIVLPINGKKYTLPPVAAEMGVEILGVLRSPDGEAAQRPDPDGMQSIRMLLGDALVDRMIKEKVPYDAMIRASQVQVTDFISGREEAEIVWRESGLHAMARAVAGAASPEAPAPKRGRTSRKPASTRTSSTGAASTTRRRASGTSTTSRKTAR
jgi:hypothetical protein